MPNERLVYLSTIVNYNSPYKAKSYIQHSKLV